MECFPLLELCAHKFEDVPLALQFQKKYQHVGSSAQTANVTMHAIMGIHILIKLLHLVLM